MPEWVSLSRLWLQVAHTPLSVGSTLLPAPTGFSSPPKSLQVKAPVRTVRKPRAPSQSVTFRVNSFLDAEPGGLPLPRSCPSLRLRLRFQLCLGSGCECHVLGLGREAGAAMLISGGANRDEGRAADQLPGVPALVRKCGSVLAPSVTGFRPVVPLRLPRDV